LKTTSPLDFSRVSFVLRDDAQLTVYESHLASGGFSSRVVEYGLQDGAKLSRNVYQAAQKEAVQVFTALIHLNERAQLSQSSLGFGAKLCRNETRVFHHGAEALAEMNSAYLIGAGRHYDQTSLVRHSHAGCTTRQVCKGAVMDEGQAVFQGKFFVARKAQQTDAEMEHHALILENGGEVNAKPELEIYADDVQCAHGNTVGALDEDALFYIRQRGLSERSARSLLTEAFILETLENVPEEMQDCLAGKSRDWLEAHL
jgi:Fe-S cluster assembly protein SufD